MSSLTTQTSTPVHDVLNQLISEFWRGTIQHQTHIELLKALGITALAQEMQTRTADEPVTLRQLTSRLLDLDGQVSIQISAPKLGRTLHEVLVLDLQVQEQTRPVLNQAAELVAAQHDAVTRRLIEDILISEESHLAWLKNEVSLLERLGEATYLANRL